MLEVIHGVLHLASQRKEIGKTKKEQNSGSLVSLQVNDLVKLGLLISMIRTYYYFTGTYFYLDLVGGIVFSTSFDQFFYWFLSGFWWLWVVSWNHFWSFMRYHAYIWQPYMLANSLNNPAGNAKQIRISTSLHLPHVKFVVYYLVPRITPHYCITGNPGLEPLWIDGI